MSISNPSIRSKSSHHSSGSGSGVSSSFSKILSLKTTIEKGLFGVTYAMVKNNTFPKILTIISIIIEFLQLCSFGFKKSFGYGGRLGDGLETISSPLSQTADIVQYQGYTILFWVVIGLLGLGMMNILYVAYQFYGGRIANIWILRTLRWFVTFSVAVLFIPILSLLLVGLNCETKDGISVVSGFDQRVECYGKDNISKTIVSIMMILLFGFISFSSQATYYEYDTSCKDRYSKPHSRFDITVLIVKTILAIFFELLEEYPWVLSVILVLCMIWLCVGSIVFLPFNNQILNQVKSGFYFVALFCSLCSLLTLIVNNNESPATAYLAIVSAPFVFVGGFLCNRFFYIWLSRKVLKFQVNDLRSESLTDLESQNVTKGDGSTVKVTFGTQPRTLGSQKQIKFNFFEKKYAFAFFVEIMCRKLLESQEPSDIDRANLVYQCALQYFPKSHLLWMAYCNFLFTVRKDRQIGYAALEKLRRISPPFDVRFYIYQRDKEREQIMDSDLRGPDHQGKIQDFVSYMEFKKLYNNAKRSHLKCLQIIQRFWKLLLHETIDLHRLSDLSGRIATNENRANEHYERLLALNPNSVRVLRDFSQFLEDVVKDKDSALRLQKKAEHIEDIMSKSLSHEHIKILQDGINGDDQINVVETDGINLDKINNIDKLDRAERGSQHSKSKESDSSVSSKGRQKRYQEFQQSNSITKLSWFMVLSVVLSMVFCIAALVSLRSLSLSHVHAYQGILTLGDGAVEAVQLAKDLNHLHLLVDENRLDEIEPLKKEINIRIITLQNIHNAMYYGESDPVSYNNKNKWLLKKKNGYKVYPIDQRVFSYSEFNKTNTVKSPLLKAIYNEPVVPVSIYLVPSLLNNDTNSFINQTYNAWNSINVYIQSGSLLVNLSNEELADSIELNPNYRFIINNQNAIASAFNDLQLAYSNVLKLQVESLKFIIIYIWLGSFALQLLLAIIFFRPVVSKISREKMRTLILFSLAPRDIVIKMATKKIKMVSLDSGSDRDFASDEDHHKHETDDEDEAKNTRKSTIVKSSTTVFGASGDSLLHISDSSKKHLLDSLRPHHIKSSLGYEEDDNEKEDENNNNNNNSDQNQPEEEPERNEENSMKKGSKSKRKYAWNGVNKRNLNKKSLRSTLKKLHFSYCFALFLLFGFITMGLFVSLTESERDSGSGIDIVLSSQRSVYTRLTNFYVSTIVVSYDELVNYDPRHGIVQSIDSMQKVHQSIEFIEEVRTIMETGDCWLIDQPCQDSLYQSDLSRGLSWVLDQFTKHSLNLARTSGKVTDSDMDYNWIHSLAETYIYAGLDRATYNYFKHWHNVQENSVEIITAVMSVAIVSLLLVYIIVFRPFIYKLRIQHIHTLALLRLAPDDIRNMEVSDKVIDED